MSVEPVIWVHEDHILDHRERCMVEIVVGSGDSYFKIYADLYGDPPMWTLDILYIGKVIVGGFLMPELIDYDYSSWGDGPQLKDWAEPQLYDFLLNAPCRYTWR